MQVKLDEQPPNILKLWMDIEGWEKLNIAGLSTSAYDFPPFF